MSSLLRFGLQSDPFLMWFPLKVTQYFFISTIHSNLCTSVHYLRIDHRTVSDQVLEAYELCSPSSVAQFLFGFKCISDPHFKEFNKREITFESINMLFLIDTNIYFLRRLFPFPNYLIFLL